MKINKPAKEIAPPTVKTKVADAKVEKGWSGVDPNAQAQIKEKIKTENPKNIPPPTAGGNAAAAAGASVSVSPGTSVAPGMAPIEKGKYKGKGAEQFQAGATTSPAGALTSPTTSPAFPERGKKKSKLGEQAQPGASLAPTESRGAEVSPYTQIGRASCRERV